MKGLARAGRFDVNLGPIERRMGRISELEAGHFALDTKADEIAALIQGFAA
jgi:hypothetical protein